jgi:hypothetical protein
LFGDQAKHARTLQARFARVFGSTSNKGQRAGWVNSGDGPSICEMASRATVPADGPVERFVREVRADLNSAAVHRREDCEWRVSGSDFRKRLIQYAVSKFTIVWMNGLGEQYKIESGDIPPVTLDELSDQR